MGQINYVGSIMMAGLFAIALLTFAINFGIDNNAPVNIQNDTPTNTQLISLNQSVNAFVTDANGSTIAVYQADFSEGADLSSGASSLKLGGGGYISIAKDAIQLAYNSIFGGDQQFNIILKTLLAFLVLSGAWYFWAAVKGGNV